MDLQGIMLINVMGSDQIVTDKIQPFEAVGWLVSSKITWNFTDG